EQEPLVSFEELRQALVEQVEAAQHQFKVKHRHLLKWAGKHGYNLDFLRGVTGQAVVSGGLMASLLFSAPQQIAHESLVASPMHQDQQIEQQVQEAYQARKKIQMTVLAARQQQADQQT